MTAEVTAWVGLGANVGEPAAQLRRALEAMAALEETTLACRSSLYRTPPMGPPGQPDYLNAVAGLVTVRSPEALLEALLAIETRLGRRRDGQVWGPRVIDLDLLCYGDQRRDTAFLHLPHPGIAERAFVLKPWAEVAPSLEIPGLGRVDALLARLDSRDIVKWEE